MRGLIILLTFIFSVSVYSHDHRGARSLTQLLQQVQDVNERDPAKLVCEEGSEKPPVDKCEDFYEYVCSDDTQIDRWDAFQEESTKQYISSIPSMVPDDKEAVEYFKEADKYDVISWFHERTDLWQESLSQTEKRVQESTGITQEDLVKVFREVQQETINFVKDLSVSEERKKQVLTSVQKINLLNTNETIDYLRLNLRRLLEAKGTSNEEILQIEENALPVTLLTYQSVCGTGGVSMNAFALLQEPVVHICPGMLNYFKHIIKSSKEETLASIKLIFAHEIGHNLPYEELIGEFNACMSKPIGFQAYDSLSDEDKATLLRNQAKEFYSDMWLQKVVESQIQKQNLKGDNAAQYIKNQFQFFCTSPDLQVELPNESHPSSRIRITLMSRYPAMKEAIGCSAPSNEAPACTGAGRVPNL